MNEKEKSKNPKFAWVIFSLCLILGIVGEFLQTKGIVKTNDVRYWPVEAIGSFLFLLAYKNFNKKSIIKVFCLVMGVGEAIISILCVISNLFGFRIPYM